MRNFRDDARWDDVDFVSVDVGSRNKSKKLIFDGYQYATKGERQLAELLSLLGIAFTPDVPFWLLKPDGRSRLFVPDFVFNRRGYVWNGGRRPVLIHGIEAKGKKKFDGPDGKRVSRFSERAQENVAMLKEQRGVVILLLSNSSIKQYAAKRHLPLHPLTPSP